MPRVLLATSNPGKLRDFSAAAELRKVRLAAIPGFQSLPTVEEDGSSFEENARKKASHYSRFAPSEMVIADDSGLEVDALRGAPGVRSARYAGESAPPQETGSHPTKPKSGLLGTPGSRDAANNARLLREIERVPDGERGARFVCVIAAARDGQVLRTFRDEVQGEVLRAPRGSGGFGYDPLFFLAETGKTFAELAPEEKSRHSHRGRAFQKFLAWYQAGAQPD